MTLWQRNLWQLKVSFLEIVFGFWHTPSPRYNLCLWVNYHIGRHCSVKGACCYWLVCGPQEELSGQVCLDAVKTLATMMESLLLSDRNPKISIKGLSAFEFDLKQCKGKYRESSALSWWMNEFVSACCRVCAVIHSQEPWPQAEGRRSCQVFCPT